MKRSWWADSLPLIGCKKQCLNIRLLVVEFAINPGVRELAAGAKSHESPVANMKHLHYFLVVEPLLVPWILLQALMMLDN